MRVLQLRGKSIVGVGAAGAVALGISLAGAPAAHAGPSWSELQYCTLGAVDCAYGNDAANWASSITQWRYQDYGPKAFHGGIADAYRHCTWGAALAQRVGEDRAMTLLTVHELDASDGDDHVQMDMENDRTGVSIGARANSRGGSDTWGWIMKQCAAQADSGQLTTLW
ncbi:DUF6973 domain-containing protein [Rhodococcus qingshengii]|uniref:DUF6973 domain-containing protein n=1 Tax=Rhodococcus qingshengii TaxID=334542 RepID=UPI00237C7CF5|nr:hypothetical protein [Rhodococcus qingshengii]WCT06142.1 hypothetical protein PI247_31585 [Rhodococcus qingshengii]